MSLLALAVLSLSAFAVAAPATRDERPSAPQREAADDDHDDDGTAKAGEKKKGQTKKGQTKKGQTKKGKGATQPVRSNKDGKFAHGSKGENLKDDHRKGDSTKSEGHGPKKDNAHPGAGPKKGSAGPKKGGTGPKKGSAGPKKGSAGPKKGGSGKGDTVVNTPVQQVTHVSFAPQGWTPDWHRTEEEKTSHWSPEYWSKGVFQYSPPKKGEKVEVVEKQGGETVRAPKEEQSPRREVDRRGDVSVGLRAATFASAYQGGGLYADPGTGLSLGYRPIEWVGLQLDWTHHRDTWTEAEPSRVHDPIQASVQLFAFPWTHVSPYATVGWTWSPYEIHDSIEGSASAAPIDEQGVARGGHAGLGIEFALGEHAALGLDARYLHLSRLPQGAESLPSALQATAGLKAYF
jgi:hypothetical protein